MSTPFPLSDNIESQLENRLKRTECVMEEPLVPCNQKKQKLGEKPPVGMLTFDPSGDIRLILENPSGKRTAHFIVSSKSLISVSPVFRAMFDGRFIEGQAIQASTTGPATSIDIGIADDDQSAMAICLYLAHHQLERVPTCLTWDQYYALAVLFDKYDFCMSMKELLKIRAGLGSSGGLLDDIDANSYSSIPPGKVLFISYVFRLTATFQRISHDLILNCSERELTASDDNPVFTEALPQSIEDEIKTRRYATIKKISATFDALFQRYEKGAGSCGKFECQRQIAECDSIIFGILFHTFVKLGLHPPEKRNTTLLAKSVKDAADLLDAIVIPAGAFFREVCCANPSFLDVLHNNTRRHHCMNCGVRYKAETVKHVNTCSLTMHLGTKKRKILSSIKGLELVDTVASSVEPVWDWLNTNANGQK